MIGNKMDFHQTTMISKSICKRCLWRREADYIKKNSSGSWFLSIRFSEENAAFGWFHHFGHYIQIESFEWIYVTMDGCPPMVGLYKNPLWSWRFQTKCNDADPHLMYQARVKKVHKNSIYQKKLCRNGRNFDIIARATHTHNDIECVSKLLLITAAQRIAW